MVKVNIELYHDQSCDQAIVLLFVDAPYLITPTQLHTLSSDENSIHFANVPKSDFILCIDCNV